MGFFQTWAVRGILVLGFLTAVPVKADLQIRFDQPVENELKFLETVESRLPILFRLRLDENIRVEFDDLKDGVFGKTNFSFFGHPDTLTLDYEVRDFVSAGPDVFIPSPEPTFPNAWEFSVSVLVHELAHLYNDNDLRTEDEQEYLEECRRGSSGYESVWCDRIKRRRKTVTRTSIFRYLADWPTRGLIIRSPTQTNKKESRRPRDHERKNLDEFFAYNFERFTRDPEFKCRRPAVFNFYREHFVMDPYPDQPCPRIENVSLMHTGLGESRIESAKIDPSRVYQIHYLFATEGSAIMSKWGHGMLRLVMCSPEREEMSQACLDEDIADDIVVSYRANIPDIVINYWKGLTGEYPSDIFLYPFIEVLNEYTKDELRNLESLPLNLTDVEKELMTSRILERHYAYQGDYYFITNNCGTEILSLLKSIIADPFFHDKNAISPLGLRNLLIEQNIVDARALNDLRYAKDHSFYFDSKSSTLNDMFGYLKTQHPQLAAFDDFEEYRELVMERWNLINSEVRLEIYADILENADDSLPLRKVAANFFLLESHLLRHMKYQFAKKHISEVMVRFFDDPEDPALENYPIEDIENLLSIQERSKLLVAKSGYGILLEKDLPENFYGLQEEMAEEFQSESKRVLEMIMGMFEEESAQILESAKLRRYFFKEMIRHEKRPETKNPRPSGIALKEFRNLDLSEVVEDFVRDYLWDRHRIRVGRHHRKGYRLSLELLDYGHGHQAMRKIERDTVYRARLYESSGSEPTDSFTFRCMEKIVRGMHPHERLRNWVDQRCTVIEDES